MTEGAKLKKRIGLEDYKTVYTARLILPHTQMVLMVFYNSLRKDGFFSKRLATQPPFTGMTYSGRDLAQDDFEKPTMTPLLDIESWNGDMKNYIITMVDVAYSFRLNKRDFSRLPESKKQEILYSLFLEKGKLQELSIADLRDKSNVSDFTMTWRKDKNRQMGAENKTAKLIDVILDQSDNSVTFQFLTEATELKKEPSKTISSPYKYYAHDKSEVEHGEKTKKSNPSKTYEMQMKFLNFFDWLKVYDGEEINRSTMKELLEVLDVQLSSTSPSFLFQGTQYWLHQLGGSIYPEDRAPQRWNASHLHGSGNFLSKDLYGLLQQMPFFENQMAGMLNKKLKDRNLI